MRRFWAVLAGGAVAGGVWYVFHRSTTSEDGDTVRHLGKKVPEEHVVTRLRILTCNDVYEIVNLPRVKTAFDALRLAPNQGTTVATLPGDFLAPSLLSSIDSGKGMVDLMNKCGFDYVSFGNHENDIPYDQLLHRIKQSRFQWLNTNMKALPLPEDLADRCPDHCLLEVSGPGDSTRKVGLIGLLTEDKNLYRPGKQ